MKRKNIARNALFTSIISLMLCISMLVGTTFAWFTDSVVSGNNIIAAGNLDVELYHSNKAVQNEKVNGETELFSDIKLWEPGVVVYENFVVANEGNLALKYQLSINITDETVVNGHGLSEALKVAVVEGGFSGDRAAAHALWNTQSDKVTFYDLASFVLSGELEGTEKSNTYGIVIYWEPTDNDNLFNLKDVEKNEDGSAKNPLSITMGVNLFATQEMYEDDSFGPDYDAGADDDVWVDGFDVYSEQDLNAAIANGETAIDVMADIALTEAVVIPEGATVALNLNGNTISNDDGYVFENKGNLTIGGNGTATGLGLIRSTAGTVTIENGNFYASSRWQDGVFQHTLKAENSNVVINGGNFDATVGGQNNAMLNASTNATITINGGNFKNVAGELTDFDPYIATYEQNGKIVINDGTFYGGWRFNAETASTVINGGDFNLSYDGQSFHANSTHTLTVYGGEFAAKSKFAKNQLSNHVASGYKAVESNGKYIVVSENVDGVVTTAAGLADAIAQGGVVSVMADIDMNNAWTSVVPANGLVIEGNDHVISNLNLPLMAGKGGAVVTVKGLTIADSNVGIAANEKGLGTGAFIAFADYSGTLVFEDCHMVNSTVTGNERAAAFVGYSYADVTIKDCSVDKCTIEAVGSTAALIGHANGVTTIEKTSVTNTKVTATEDRTGSTAVAGSLIGTVANTTALNKVTSSNNTVSNTGATPYSAEFGRIVSPGKLIVDGAELKTASSQAALDAAVSSTGNVEITLTNGEYKMPSSGTTGEVTITGTKDTVLDMTMGAYMESANVTIDGVTIKTSTGMVNGNGADYAALYTPNVTYKDCTFVGPLRVGRDGAKFINCTFTALGNDYIWTYGNDVTFEGCTFNTAGKAILIYSDGGNEIAKVTVKDCIFNSTQGAKAGAIANQNCAAIEIHNYGNGVNLVTEGNTYDSNFSGEWRIKTYETGRTQIFVNGVEYTQIAIDGKLMTIDADKNVTFKG